MAEQKYYYGTGRRKTSVARVKLVPGNGVIIVNGAPYEEIFNRYEHQRAINKPFIASNTEGKFNAMVKVEGGGITGWSGAICMGVARALVAFDEALKPALKQQGLLTRDSRVKERKKTGLRRARKAPQYTKR